MVKDIFPELRLDVPNIEKQIAPNMLCLRDIEVLLKKKSVLWLFTGGGCLQGSNHSGSLTTGVTYTATFWKRIYCTQFYN